MCRYIWLHLNSLMLLAFKKDFYRLKTFSRLVYFSSCYLITWTRFEFWFLPGIIEDSYFYLHSISLKHAWSQASLRNMLKVQISRHEHQSYHFMFRVHNSVFFPSIFILKIQIFKSLFSPSLSKCSNLSLLHYTIWHCRLLNRWMDG